jgi:hypothetical protein
MPLNPKGIQVNLVEAKCGNLVAEPERGDHHMQKGNPNHCIHGYDYDK